MKLDRLQPSIIIIALLEAKLTHGIATVDHACHIRPLLCCHLQEQSSGTEVSTQNWLWLLAFCTMTQLSNSGQGTTTLLHTAPQVQN